MTKLDKTIEFNDEQKTIIIEERTIRKWEIEIVQQLISS